MVKKEQFMKQPALGIILILGIVFGSGIRASQPDLCVVLVDSLRADHLGCYGYERDTSPEMDAFAEGAVRFDQAIASLPYCDYYVIEGADHHMDGESGNKVVDLSIEAMKKWDAEGR